MELRAELERIASAAAEHAAEGEELAGVIAAEPADGERAYLCAFLDAEGGRTWLVLDADGEPVRRRTRVRDVASVAALCELAEETAGGGDLEELRAQLVTLRLTENPPGIDEAEEAALALESTIGAPPRVATLGYLDDVGAATRRLELALGEQGGSPFATAMKQGRGAVDELAAEVVEAYKVELDG